MVKRTPYQPKRTERVVLRPLNSALAERELRPRFFVGFADQAETARAILRADEEPPSKEARAEQ